MAGKKNQKIVKMKRKQSPWLGLMLLFFAVCLLVLCIQSFTKDHVSIYEVTQKQLADNQNLRGIVLREEQVVKTKKSGYINYYVGEGSRLSKTTTVYSVAKGGNTTEMVSAADGNQVTLSEEDTTNIRNEISNYLDNDSLSDYKSILNFRYNVENAILELSDVNLADNLKKIRKESGKDTSFSVAKADRTGIISYSTDGLEGLSIDDLSPDYFKEMTDHWSQLRSSKSVKKGSPIYRLVTSEKWSIAVLLTKEQFFKLSQKKSVLVKIKKDGISMIPTVRTFTSNGKYYANLIFDKYMIHYLNNRYLDIEIQFNNASGLKIPTSSIVKKKCYVIPKKYITMGTGKSNKQGVANIYYDKKSGQEKLDFTPTEIYYKDEDDNVYIDANVLPAGTTIVCSENEKSERMELTTVKSLEGVYNSNQGYCRFRCIKKLYENQEYAIVEKDNIYGLSCYDHIVLNPEMIGAEDILY